MKGPVLGPFFFSGKKKQAWKMPVYFSEIPKNQVFRGIFRAGVSVNHLSINHTVEDDAEVIYSYAHHPDSGSPYTSSRTVDLVGITNVEELLDPEPEPGDIPMAWSARITGMVQYEITNHLGNVQAVINDKKLAVEEENIVTYHSGLIFATDYYPFGMTMPERALNTPEYRYGFNGKEKDDEVKGIGAQYDYGFRIYDARQGRFLSVDPLAGSYSWYTPYQFSGNKPIWKIDLDGLEEADSKANSENSNVTYNDLNYFQRGVLAFVRLLSGYQDYNDRNGGVIGKMTGTYEYRRGDEIYGAYDAVVTSFTLANLATGGALDPTDIKMDGNSGGRVGRSLDNIVDVTSDISPIIRQLDSKRIAESSVIGIGILKPELLDDLSKVRNPVPDRLARVLPANVDSKMLGLPNQSDVFVTAADDIFGLNAKEIATRLTIPYDQSGFKIIEFDTPKIGLGSPVNRDDPGFIGLGRTQGGAREFTVPNQLIPKDAKTKIVRK